MLLYSWTKIFEMADGNPNDCFVIFKMMTEGLIPRNKYDKIYKFYDKDFRGSSFLLHPDVLLYNSYKYTKTEIAQYLALASLRILAEYYVTKDTTLDLLKVPFDKELFNDNRLLWIDDEDRLHFLYEEVPQEKH